MSEIRDFSNKGLGRCMVLLSSIPIHTVSSEQATVVLREHSGRKRRMIMMYCSMMMGDDQNCSDT